MLLTLSLLFCSDYPARFLSSAFLQFGLYADARRIYVRNTPTRHSREGLCGHGLPLPPVSLIPFTHRFQRI